MGRVTTWATLLILGLQGCATAGEAGPCTPDVSWLDRIEGDRAVLLGPGEEVRAVPLASLPAGASEGQALRDGRLAPACARWMRDEVRRRREALAGRDP